MSVPPGPCTAPTMAPSPTPMETRNRTGSKKPDSMTSQLVLLVAISPREITALALREYSGPNVLVRAACIGATLGCHGPCGDAHCPILRTNWRLVRIQPSDRQANEDDDMQRASAAAVPGSRS